MNDVTRILSAIEQGDPAAAEQLLPLSYQELRRLAAQKLAQEKPGQTLQATALVHEAYLRLVDAAQRPSTGTAAATSSPRRPRPCAASSSRAPAARSGQKHGGGRQRVDLDEPRARPYQSSGDDILALDEALQKLAADRSRTRPSSSSSATSPACPWRKPARAAGIPRSTAYAHWAYARACLRCLLQGGEGPEGA